MTTITIPRALLEQALKALELGFEDYDAFAVEIETEAIQALRAELAKQKLDPTGSELPNKQANQQDLTSQGQIPTGRDAPELAKPVDVRHEQELAAYEITVANLRAERDDLLKLINGRKIHPHDIPLEIFIADLSTRTANVLRAEFDSFRHTDGAYDIEPPFTVRHLLMFSRQEIKKWPGIGKKGLNEIEENLRARGLQMWHAHDDRSLRLLREHKSYFVDHAKAEGRTE